MKKGFTSEYKKSGRSIIATYKLDVSYYKATIRLHNSLTEYSRTNLIDVPYEDQCSIYSSCTILKGENFDCKVFNPFVADFLENYFDFLEPYEVGYKKGMKHFNKTYKVKAPNPEQIKLISNLYNEKFKNIILSLSKVLNIESIEQIGFKNGILSAYADYEESYLELFLNTLPPQQGEKPKPELNEALISFSSTEIIESLHSDLKGYFQGKEAELKKALQGEQLKEFLLFPHNQNKFVEVFKRLKYNGFLLSTPKETKDWICSNFTYQYQKGDKKEVREFNTSTVHDILTKDKGEPTKKERICIVDWLPYKSHLTRQREAEKEFI